MSRYIITEVFDTIQGEGALVGQRMVFVRFSGCNLWNGLESGRATGKGDCARWCDTDFRPRMTLTQDELLAKMDALWPAGSTRWCCLTGGEPTLQVTPDLISALKRAGWCVAIETNGTGSVDLSGADHVTVSPKVGGIALGGRCDSLKVVLPGWWPDQMAMLLNRWKPTVGAFVQPQSGHPESLEMCLSFVRMNPQWRLSVQTHKLIGVP